MVCGGMIVLPNGMVIIGCGNRLKMEGEDDTYQLQLWDINQGKCLKVSKEHNDSIVCIKIYPIIKL